jgi:hypothetical protein
MLYSYFTLALPRFRNSAAFLAKSELRENSGIRVL